MAKRRTYKRNRKGQFASAASRSTQVKRSLPTRVVRGSVRHNVRVGRVGPGGQYAGFRAGVELKPRKGKARYYVGVTAGRKIAH